MLKIFSDKSAPTHSRSKTLSHIQSPITNPTSSPASLFEDDFQNAPLASHRPSGADPAARDLFFPAIAPREPGETHQRTLTNHSISLQDLPPLLQTCPQAQVLERSRQSSPTRTKHTPLSILTGEKDSKTTSEKAGKLAKWFDGESEPISIGILPSPVKEVADPLDAKASSTIRPTTLLQRKSTVQAITKPAMASRFSFFSSKASLTKPIPQSTDPYDELFNLDISTAFPEVSSEPTSSPTLRNIQQQAESLFTKLQNACKERSTALWEMTAENETLAEETQGAETRTKHLKLQLDDMSVKLGEQDEAMMNLVDELAREKLARREEAEARKYSIRLVDQGTPSPIANGQISRSNTMSDSGFDSEDDSCADSVFSRLNGTHSPTLSLSSVSTASSPDAIHTADLYPISSTGEAARFRLPTSQSGLKGKPPLGRTEPRQQSCANCEGVRASEAWSVVGILKEENQGLKQRVGDLEGALDGCLDVVGRLS